MKKGILIFLLVVVFGFLFWKWFFNQPCLPPDRPDALPKEAVWKGGCDGGNWIEFVSIEKEKIRFRIYRDWNGELILDADFNYIDCNTTKLTETNWSEQIAYFDEALKLNNGKCRLEPIYPAHQDENQE